MSSEPRWNQGEKPDEPQALGDDVNFRDITARMERAGWITDIHFETADALTVDFTPVGLERVRELKKILRPIIDYIDDNTKPKPSIESSVAMMMCSRHLLQEVFHPPFEDIEIYKLVVFLKAYAPG